MTIAVNLLVGEPDLLRQPSYYGAIPKGGGVLLLEARP